MRWGKTRSRALRRLGGNTSDRSRMFVVLEHEKLPVHEVFEVSQTMEPLVRGNRVLFAGWVYPPGCLTALNFHTSRLVGRMLTAKLGFIVLVKCPTDCREIDLEIRVHRRHGRDKCDRESGPG